jgi:hypothetical protein
MGLKLQITGHFWEWLGKFCINWRWIGWKTHIWQGRLLLAVGETARCGIQADAAIG